MGFHHQDSRHIKSESKDSYLDIHKFVKTFRLEKVLYHFILISFFFSHFFNKSVKLVRMYNTILS